MVKALAWTVRDVGLSLAWCYTFHLYKFTLRENYYLIHISELRMFR